MTAKMTRNEIKTEAQKVSWIGGPVLSKEYEARHGRKAIVTTGEVLKIQTTDAYGFRSTVFNGSWTRDLDAFVDRIISG